MKLSVSKTGDNSIPHTSHTRGAERRIPRLGKAFRTPEKSLLRRGIQSGSWRFAKCSVLIYTQGVGGSSPAPPTFEGAAVVSVRNCRRPQPELPVAGASADAGRRGRSRRS